MTAELMRALSMDLQARNTGGTGLSLNSRLGYEALDRYLTGSQPLSFMHPDVMAQVEGRLQPLVVNWARVIVSSIEERLDIEGFRLGADTAADEDLWRIWQANNLDEWSQLGHVDAMAHGRAFGLVWGDEEFPETPRISVESATQMTVRHRPGSRRVEAAAKVYRDPDSDPNAASQQRIGWLYLPDRTEKYTGTVVGGSSASAWTKVDELPNPLGAVPVVPIVNRPRLTDPAGESELVDVIPLVDAVNKLATDMMVSSEFHAMPRRYATGIEIPREAQSNERLKAEAQRQWDDATKGKTWLAGPGVAFGQFPEAQLENFISAIKLLVSQIAAIAGLPPHYLGLSSDNPASADAIRSAEASLVQAAVRKQRGFGGSWEQVMRLAVAVRDGVPLEKLDARYDRLETQWRDANTPTPGQKADAAQKLLAAGVIDVDQAREDLGYTPGQIAAMNARQGAAQAEQVTADVRARVAQAEQLQAAQGLSQPAAFAAVGLLAAAQQMNSTGGQPSVAGGGQPAQ